MNTTESPQSLLKRLISNWVDDFPQVKQNMYWETDGQWLCWATFKDFGTVLWRQKISPGRGNKQIYAVGFELAGLPKTSGLIPDRAVLFQGCVDLQKLGERLVDQYVSGKPVEGAPKPRKTGAQKQQKLEI